MDPATIAATVAALVATNAVGGFAGEAGSQAWDALQKIVASLRSRLSPRGAQALESLEARPSDASRQAGLAVEIEALANSNDEFRETMANLLSIAERGKPLAAIIAVARDHARQINIAGNNSGAIDMG